MNFETVKIQGQLIPFLFRRAMKIQHRKGLSRSDLTVGQKLVFAI